MSYELKKTWLGEWPFGHPLNEIFKRGKKEKASMKKESDLLLRGIAPALLFGVEL